MSAKARRALLAAGGLIAVSALTAILSWPGTALATPAQGFSVVALTKSFFEEIRVISATIDGDDTDDPKIKIISKEPSDVYAITTNLAVATATTPPGSTGWHSHPGPSVVLVKSGTASVYQGDDPTCTPVRYPARSGFAEPGGAHVHMVRNEGTELLVLQVFQIIPAGAPRRIDGPANTACPNL
jgi:hypothetical protein